MYEFSNLRMAGVLLGLAALAWVFFDLRRYRVRRINPASMLVFALASLALALWPGLVDAPADFMGLSGISGGRLIALLIVSNVLLWLLAIRHRGRLGAAMDDLTATMRHLAVAEFAARHASLPPQRVWVVIPVFNEAANIEAVVSRVPNWLSEVPLQVLVVDDGSTDGSATAARSAGAVCARLPRNCGGGAALLTGFEIALSHEARAVVTMDGDGQHDPAAVEALIAPIVSGRADVVIGSRILGRHDAKVGLRSVGVHFFSRLINLLMGSRITDCSSGFRAIAPGVLRAVALREPQYHAPELLIGAIKRGLVVTEVPIHIRQRLSGKSKKGADLRYGWMFVRSIVRAWLR